ncbi:protein jagged-1-like isoform X1 [Haliotis asinina]|uniref:protein jagged-1-like isoform X1 n=1 Tax=Haliotis asinina TaxID=109174 RepID=UPI0035327F83
MLDIPIVLSALLVLCAKQTTATGVFEVKIRALYNDRGQTADGNCCSGTRTTSSCSEECRIFVSVCLLHFQNPIPPSPACTYGSEVTPVIGGNTIGVGNELDDGPYIIRVPLSFLWPESFAVLVEAWHDAHGNESRADPRNLVIRTGRAGKIKPSTVWKNESQITMTADIRYSYRVICDPHYYGDGCDRLCRPRDNTFGHYHCDKNGSRICMDGWVGEFCDKARCTDVCLESHGFCDRPYECKCRFGWRGSNCDKCVTFRGCLHGTCREAWQCLCEDGWSGSLCSIDNNYCASYQPCLHGGTCNYDSVSNFTCTCPSGYTGNRCQFETCFRGYCLNGGACEESAEGRTCRCRRGFQGRRCQHKEVTCGELSCRNNGTCMRESRHWRCLCPPGFTGLRCEVEINECESSPCRNGGLCRDRVNGYHCECPDGYAGKVCDYVFNACQGFECFNGGTCRILGKYTPKCFCREEFTGYRCETPLNPCYGITCLHGGTCKKINELTFECACAPGYTGSLCQRRDTETFCENSPCRNGGTCKSYTDSFLCICEPGFEGELCETSLASDEPWGNSITDGKTPNNVQALENSASRHSTSVPILLSMVVLRTFFLVSSR